MFVYSSTSTRQSPSSRVDAVAVEHLDGTPRTYRDRKAFAIEAAERLKRKHPNSDICGERLTERRSAHDQVQTRFGAALTFTNSRRARDAAEAEAAAPT